MSVCPPTPPAVLNVLVVGASGAVGSNIAAGLLSPKWTSRVRLSLLVRHSTATTEGPKKVSIEHLVSQGAQLVFGDLNESSEAELTRAFQGVNVLVSAVGVPQLADQLKLIKPAKAAGVSWFVPSEFGFDAHLIGRGSAVPLFDVKLEVEAAARAAGIESLTLINTGTLSEWLFSTPFFGVDLAAGTITAPGSFDVSTNTTPLADIGRLTADAIVSGRGKNKTIWTGHQVTYAQIADVYERATGKSLTRRVRPVADAEAAVVANPRDLVSGFAVVLAKQAGKGMGVPQEETYAAQHHIEQQSLEDFVRQLTGTSK